LDKFRVDCSSSFLRGARPLWKAYCYAYELRCDPWEFAVGIDSLRLQGLENNDLRWLVQKGYIASAVETKPIEKSRRCFYRSAGLAFPRGTCFVLTSAGAQFLEEVIARTESGANQWEDNVAPAAEDSSASPWWDAENRELRFDGQLVKQFKVPAPNQELILASFQEQAWPHHVDDPLPPLPELDSKRRLHDTICRLNRNQKHRLLRFRGDGRGSGLYWEVAM